MRRVNLHLTRVITIVIVMVLTSVYNNHRLQGVKQGRFVPVSNMERLEPVSYTHLDVYKRQHIGSAHLLLFFENYCKKTSLILQILGSIQSNTLLLSPQQSR